MNPPEAARPAAGPAAPQRRRRTTESILDRDWVLALSVAFFVGVVIWFGGAVRDFFGSTGNVLVPMYVGQTLADANGDCARLKLVCTVVERQTSDTYPSDVVMGQQPAAGTHVRAGRAVSFIVSNGVQIFPMPDLRFESLRNARLIMGRDKLQLAGTKTVTDDDVPAESVVAQDPPPLTSVREGSAVSLTLSRGPPSSVKVPDFVDMTIDQARYAAIVAKIQLGQVVWTPFGPHGPPRGTVVRQAPGPGGRIDPFSPVSLQVSAGPTEYGYLVRQVHVGVTVPVRDNAAQLRLTVHDETGSWNVYDAYVESGQKLDFNLTAIGTAELDTYVNNELLDKQTLGVEPPRLPTGKPAKAR